MLRPSGHGERAMLRPSGPYHYLNRSLTLLDLSNPLDLTLGLTLPLTALWFGVYVCGGGAFEVPSRGFHLKIGVRLMVRLRARLRVRLRVRSG